MEVQSRFLTGRIRNIGAGSHRLPKEKLWFSEMAALGKYGDAEYEKQDVSSGN